MKKIVCEMCGSSDLLKDNGVFVCQTCGTKYSVEEAKKMMVEGTVDVKGIVKVDNSDKIENYLKIAKSAIDSGNNKEAEEYCNKTLEIDPKHYEALFLKGKAAGWQSTLGNNRFTEAVNYFADAIKNAPDDIKEKIRDDGADEVKKLGIALISLRGENFSNNPIKSNATGFSEDIILIINTISKYFYSGGKFPEGYMEEFANIMNRSAVAAWKDILDEYLEKESDGKWHPSDYKFNNYVEQGDYCISIIEQAIKLSDDDDDADITRYNNLIVIEEQLIDACSFKYAYGQYVGSYYAKSLTLTATAKNIRKKKIEEWQKKLNELKQAKTDKENKERQERIDAYWKEHKEEKAKLEKEKKELQLKIDEVNDECSKNEYVIKSNKLQEEIEKKKEERKALKFTDFKGKKAIDIDIDKLTEQYNSNAEKVKKFVDKWDEKINAFEKKIKKIDNKLTRDPNTKNSDDDEDSEDYCTKCGKKVSSEDYINNGGMCNNCANN